MVVKFTGQVTNSACINNPDFMQNRTQVMDRCSEVGINHIDLINDYEVQVYSKLLKGERRKRWLVGYSCPQKESRSESTGQPRRS